MMILLSQQNWLLFQVMLGISDYFDLAVEKNELLYKLEKNQFQQVTKSNEDKRPVELYGSAHLLRLMVKLNSLLNMTGLELKQDVMLVEGIIRDFLEYLESNKSKFFTSKNYLEASEEYLTTYDWKESIEINVHVQSY